MVAQHYRWDFIGLSTDVKPTPATSEKVVDGSTFYCSDNSKLYVFYKDTWYEKTATGGGGGGGSYTAGDGIDITNDVISATNTGKAKELTTDDYNYDDGNTGSFNTIGLWLLDDGLYGLPDASQVNMKGGLSGSYLSYFNNWITSSKFQYLLKKGNYCWFYQGASGASGFIRAGAPVYFCELDKSTGAFTVSTNRQTIIYGNVVDGLQETASDYPLSANQGRVLNNKIGDLSTLTTTDKTNVVSAINEVAQGGGGDTVYSTKTTSNSNTGGAVYIGNLGTDQAEVADPSPNDNHYKYFWALPSSNNGATYGQPGDGTVNIMGSAKGVGSVTIGRNAGSGSYGAIRMVAIGDGANSGYDGVAIGSGAGTSQDFTGNVCIGAGAVVTDFGVTNSISLGRYSKATRAGELNIGTSISPPDEGFNSSAYRVIGGVYDGQELHDCATVAQGNTLSTSAPTTSTEGVLGQLWTDTTNMHTYQCTAISGSTYTWTQRW